MSQIHAPFGESKSVTVSGGGLRLDQFLAAQEDVKSRSSAAKMIDDGRVRIGGRKVKKASTILRSGDEVTYVLASSASVPESREGTIPLPVLFEDEYCMVVDKPAGFAVHPGSGMKDSEETILSSLSPLFAERSLPFTENEVLVHRLDRETTGCLLIAKTPKAHLYLQKQFASRTVSKTYLTLVEGTPEHPAAIIDAPIGRHPTERTKMTVHQATAARSAKTTYRTVASAGDVSLLECDLHTGRTHQIRVHLRSIGHPVLGDSTYCTPASLAAASKHAIRFLCLHAWRLSFVSPSGKKVEVKAEPPQNFLILLSKLSMSV